MPNSGSRSLPDVPDVLYHVFSYLDPIHHSRYQHDQVYESRRALAVAARTCRGFTGPALDILWKRLPDDQPLADLLCEVGIATRKQGEEYIEFPGKKKPTRYQLPNQGGGGYRLRSLEAAYEQEWRLLRGYDIRYLLRRDVGDPRKHPGWPRFVEYASRVRAITLFAFDGPAWCGIWEELQSRADGTPVLPNLLSLAFCRISWRALTPGALALISPSVCRLNFNLGTTFAWPEFDENLRCLFSQSFTSAPAIDHLRLELPLSRLGSPLLQTHCSRLRYLEVVPLLDLDGLRVLTELPALQHLSISLSSQDFPATNASLTLKSVTTLVVGGIWTNLAVFFTIVRLPSMHTLSMAGWEYGDPAAELASVATHVFHTLATRYPSITSLSISATPGYVPPPVGCVYEGVKLVPDTVADACLLDLVRPLLALAALRHLSLTFPSYFDIMCTEADLRAIAEAFTSLEAFHLEIPYYESRDPWLEFTKGPLPVPPERSRGGPLTALVHFARSCPRLRVLHLPAMEMEMVAVAEEGLLDSALAVVGDEEQPHGLRTLVIPKVLLPPGRTDLVGRVSEVVGTAFPLVASVFRPERLVVEGDWAVVADDAASRCPDCVQGPKLAFA